MVEYIRGSQRDKWHWCMNCTQYPMYIYQKTAAKPPSDLCEQCKTKQKNGNCQTEEIDKKSPIPGLKRAFPDLCYNVP